MVSSSFQLLFSYYYAIRDVPRKAISLTFFDLIFTAHSVFAKYYHPSPLLTCATLTHAHRTRLQSVQLSSKFVVLRPARLPSPAQLADSITRVARRFLPIMSSERAFLQLTLRNASFGFLTLGRLRG